MKIYTAITDNYDPPRKDIECFTKKLYESPILSAKVYKILPHLFLDDEWTVWVDGTIDISEEQAKKWIEEVKESGKGIGVLKHTWRDCIYEEAKEIVKLKRADPEIIAKQVSEYLRKGYPKHNGLACCGVIVRQNREDIKKLCEDWWYEIRNGSTRDQISFPVIFSDYHILKGDVYDYKTRVHKSAV